jgi:hypothetical protein
VAMAVAPGNIEQLFDARAVRGVAR